MKVCGSVCFVAYGVDAVEASFETILVLKVT